MNVGSGICKVLYDNGKSETVNLFKESHKVNGGGNGNELIERVLADYEEVSMLLGRIGVVLRDVCNCVRDFLKFIFLVYGLECLGESKFSKFLCFILAFHFLAGI